MPRTGTTKPFRRMSDIFPSRPLHSIPLPPSVMLISRAAAPLRAVGRVQSTFPLTHRWKYRSQTKPKSTLLGTGASEEDLFYSPHLNGPCLAVSLAFINSCSLSSCPGSSLIVTGVVARNVNVARVVAPLGTRYSSLCVVSFCCLG